MSAKSTASGLSALLEAATPAKSSRPAAEMKATPSSFASPSFLSPEPANQPQNKLTLSGKLKPQKRLLGAHQGLSRPSGDAKSFQKKAKKLKLTPALLEKTSSQKKHTEAAKSKKQMKDRLFKANRVLEDISNRRTDKHQELTKSRPHTLSHDPTRKLEFLPTPVKSQPVNKSNSEKKSKEVVTVKETEPADSSSSSSSDDSDNSDGYSSDECEVSIDAATIGNMRVVRESMLQSPALSTASSSSGMAPVGLEYQFALSSTVSSVAVAPNGKFLVVGFYNGMVYLYPLTKDSLVFRRGVLLDQILPRGMYTQIMVRVAIPDDGKFIFAGVYRGSTDIRAFEVDSITLPSPTDIPQSTKPLSSSLLTTEDSDDDCMDEDEDASSVFGLPTAKVVSHTYSDAKLKGFAAAKSLYRADNKNTEYRLLCGIGIKNVHMWRFYQKSTATGLEWSWECIFDKQTNGISLEFITFHRSIPDQFISKSEHQNVRIWHLEEDYDDTDNSVSVRKKSHKDIKQTADTVAVYGDYAYGGSESLAVVDLHNSSRMDLDLPLSAKEQRAQQEAVMNTRTAGTMRAWNPRGSRRRGAEDASSIRHMRTVSQVAGQHASPFTVGMCSDGSVFFHRPKEETGIATPLDYIEGYEEFFVDPSLDFQAQFSDLTRVNTSGLLAVLPLPETEKEKWMVVAANQDQLLVRSLDAFLHRNQQKRELSQVKSDLRNVMRDLGGADSTSDSESSSDSDSDHDTNAAKEKQRLQKKKDVMTHKRSRQDNHLKSQVTERDSKVKRRRHDIKSEKKTEKAMQRSVNGDRANTSPSNIDDAAAAVTTPKRSAVVGTRGGDKSANTASPVVSISSVSSGSSNPNTPEQPGLSRTERQLLALKELQWTPPSSTTNKSGAGNKAVSATSVVDAAAVLAQLSSNKNLEEVKSDGASKVGAGKNPSGKKATHRMKAQALFADIGSPENSANEANAKVPVKESKCESEATASSKKGKEAKPSRKRPRTVSKNEKLKATTEDKNLAVVTLTKNVKADEPDQGPEEDELDDELGEELRELEQYEPEFVLTPLASDNGSLLAATMYQYSDGDVSMADPNDGIAAEHAAVVSEQTELLMHFAAQNERMKMNFLTERERIYTQLNCSRSSHTSSKKSSSGSVGGMNWRRNVAHDYLKRKHLKRRHKKQLAAKLQQLRASYTLQIQDLMAVQQMEAGALRARQQFHHVQLQLHRLANKNKDNSAETISPSSPSTVALPIKHSALPDHLSSICFPYPDLLSSK
ncbi:hypothetical protein PHYBOEH_003696 [Phytophthora boehmeriae]|uniref:Uncharacterized protein n=1 Tax=Phytophthora boehmeriae TaxID=109152 RepID=A0A8T1WPV2_9STRA|nr:hypothetical protein PHYBOEH_003696 [Phytophthora boehmeriae]